MARGPNYGFQKHQKDLKKQKKREAKDEKKRLKAEAEAAAQGVPPQADTGETAGEDDA